MNEAISISELPPMRFSICHYCMHQVIGPPDYKQSGDPSGYACKLDVVNNRFRSIASFKMEGGYFIDGSRGCGKFEASGLPAHPLVIARMAKKNPLAETIPVDPNALEGDFDKKMQQYPHVDFDPSLPVSLYKSV